jgi:hypothetical protein
VPDFAVLLPLLVDDLLVVEPPEVVDFVDSQPAIVKNMLMQIE